MERWITRKTLLERARNQDDEMAWDEFVLYYRDFIRIIIYKMKCRQEDHDDIVQDILIKTWKSLPSMKYDRDKAKFRTWFAQLIRSCIYDHFRKIQVKDKKIDAVQNLFEIDRGFDSDLENTIEKEWKNHVLKLALRRLEKTHSETSINVFKMDLEGIKTAEISEKLNIPPNSVSTVKRRIRNKLIEEVEAIKEELGSFS